MFYDPLSASEGCFFFVCVYVCFAAVELLKEEKLDSGKAAIIYSRSLFERMNIKLKLCVYVNESD